MSLQKDRALPINLSFEMCNRYVLDAILLLIVALEHTPYKLRPLCFSFSAERDNFFHNVNRR